MISLAFLKCLPIHFLSFDWLIGQATVLTQSARPERKLLQTVAGTDTKFVIRIGKLHFTLHYIFPSDSPSITQAYLAHMSSFVLRTGINKTLQHFINYFLNFIVTLCLLLWYFCQNGWIYCLGRKTPRPPRPNLTGKEKKYHPASKSWRVWLFSWQNNTQQGPESRAAVKLHLVLCVVYTQDALLTCCCAEMFQVVWM